MKLFLALLLVAAASAQECDGPAALQCASGLVKCAKQCKSGLTDCAECLGGDFDTCCPCIKKLDAKLPLTCPNSSAVVRTSPFGEMIVREKAPELKLCSPCLSFTEQGLNILLNEILNAGVIGSCSKLCSKLGTSVEKGACDLVCGVVGVDVFIKALNHTDLDPFYFCEELDACPKGTPSADINVVQVEATPNDGPAGTKFSLEVDMTVLNATGVGEVRLNVKGPVSQPVGQGFPVPDGWTTPGNFGVKVALDTSNQAPSGQDPGVQWGPGAYTFTFEVCQGECGSKHPNSKVFGTMSGNFTIDA